MFGYITCIPSTIDAIIYFESLFSNFNGYLLPYYFLQLNKGHVFNIEAGKQALRNINSLALFSNIEVNPRPDEKNEGGIVVEIKLKELDQKSAEVSTEWSLVPGRNGLPTVVCPTEF